MNNMSKIISKCITASALILFTFNAAPTAWAESSVWDGSMVRSTKGTGSEEDPYLITTAEEMAYLIRNYDNNEGICYKKYFKLTCDLDMRSTQWTFGSAISDRKSFRSHFDGGGHKISNIEVTLKDSPGECHYGLFPQLGGDKEFESVIENLEIENIHFVRSTGDATGTYNFRIGGLVGKMYSHSRITNCLVHGFTVTDYGTDVTLHSASKISACPLVGEVLNNFADDRSFYEENNIIIEHSYGYGTPDLTHFHGRPDQFYYANAQGTKQSEGYSYNNLVWYAINDNERSFSPLNVSVSPSVGGKRFQYEGIFNRVRGHTYTYHWSIDGVRLGDYKTSTIIAEPKPYQQRLSLTVFDNGKEAGSGGILIEPDQYDLSILPEEEVKGKKKIKTHTVTAQIKAVSGLEIKEGDFEFSWQDMTDNFKEVSTSETLTEGLDGHTYLLLATHRENKAARFSIVKSFTNPIYVCNQGIGTAADVNAFTSNGKTYRKGDDRNDGRTPETAVRTLKRAYSLLKSEKEGGSIGTNVIIIMGDYEEYDFTEYLDSRCTAANASYFSKNKPAMITGRYDNFKNGRLLFAGLSIKFDADTRFEQINLSGSSFNFTDLPAQTKVFAWGHNLTMGYGIFVSGYKIMDWTLGLDEGVLAPAITLYGGILNNNDPDYVHKENTLTVLSGTYGRIIAGDGYTLQMERTGNISGSPQHPVRTRVVCDATNYFNPYHNQYDVALLIGGQADGTIFADTRIEVKGSSHIGRIVGGNVGFGRLVKGRPADSFFGKTEVTVTDGSVTEIFGTNLGRYGHILYANETEHDSCVTYFYGKSYINLLGGTIYNTIYGGGAACVCGLDYDSLHHTADPHIPYWKDGKIVFGTYKNAVNKMPIVQLKGNETLDLSKTELHVNIGGTAYLMGSLYGGSISFSSLLPTHQAGCQSGNIYADTYIDMDGGSIDGYIFGGCRGNLSYFDNSDHSSYPIVNGVQMDKLFFSNMAQMYGNTHVTVTGGEVKGLIYGGGEGPYYREVSPENLTNAVDLVATTYGNTQVNIGGSAIIRGFIFGAGNYAHVYRTDEEINPELAGNVEINIFGGQLHGAVFGAGHGNKEELDVTSIYTKVAGDVHVNVTGGVFLPYYERPRYVPRRLYGIACGGIATSTVRGNTYLNIEANPFPLELMNDSTVLPEDIILCAGGYSQDCAVVGRATITVDTKDAEKIDRIYMGGIFGSVRSTTANILSGKVERLYGSGRKGRVDTDQVNINVGVVGDSINNSTIVIDNIYGGSNLKKTHIQINGGDVLNILRPENSNF